MHGLQSAVRPADFGDGPVRRWIVEALGGRRHKAAAVFLHPLSKRSMGRLDGARNWIWRCAGPRGLLWGRGIERRTLGVCAVPPATG